MDLASIYAGLTLKVAPTVEPMSLEEAAGFLVVDPDADPNIPAFIRFARRECETVLRRALLLQTWQLSLKNWPGRDYQNWPSGTVSGFDAYHKFDHVPLPYAAPLAAVQSVIYRDTSNTPFTMPQGNVAGGYNVDVNFEPGRIVLPFSQVWPTAILLPGAPIQILYDCGCPDLATLKATFDGFDAVIQAMKLIISYCYENRIPPSEMRRSSIDAGIQYVTESILTPFRIYE